VAAGGGEPLAQQHRQVITHQPAQLTRGAECRAIDLALSDRTRGPVFLAADGRRLDRHGAGRIVRKTARRARISKAVTPHAQARIHHRRAPGASPGGA
jgi:site-specific recombinase XerD